MNDPVSSFKEWYVEHIRGIGWVIKEATFIDQHDESDNVAFICTGAFARDMCDEVVNAHNSHPVVQKNKRMVLGAYCQCEHHRGDHSWSVQTMDYECDKKEKCGCVHDTSYRPPENDLRLNP